MIVSKSVPIATLMVDSNSGSIWLNGADKCILRIQGLQFVNFEEKFSMIDINVKENKAIMIKDDLLDSKGLIEFMGKVGLLLSCNMITYSDKKLSKEFFNNLYDNVKEFIENSGVKS